MATRIQPGSLISEHFRKNGDRPALISQVEPALTYADLADQVEDFAARLGPERKLVMLAGRNDTSALIAYLGILAAGSVVLVVPETAAGPDSTLTRTYNPDVVVSVGEAGWEIATRNATSVHDLHPDLALCLSTSGSTGSPKLVRLSYRNLVANAQAIGTYLSLTSDDRAITTLPMYYCYGLSVIHSYLVAGATLMLTNDSVIDKSFWSFFRQHRATSIAGVPYTYELLDQAGFAKMHLPSLRYMTVSGGRLAPAKVKEYAGHARQAGWQLFPMYGSTEATSRMAYMPPELVFDNPECVGVPIPGGAFRLDPVDGLDDDMGELVYTGPNIMLGYAQSASDLAKGRELDELRTGDIARRKPNGLYQIVGRSARFIKLFGIRIDLQRIESVLESQGLTAVCTGDDEQLVVAVQGRAAVADIRARVAAITNLPAHVIQVVTVDEFPRLGAGKVDYAALRELAADASTAESQGDVRDLFAQVLRIPAAEVTDNSTFVNLGGDSMSFVTMSVRLEKLLGTLPADWHTKTVAELRAHDRQKPGRWRTVETGIVLRALAILLIVVSHTGLMHAEGGAHFLLAASGYYFARFILSDKPRSERVKHSITTLLRIAIPCLVWIVLVRLTLGTYALSNALFVNRIFGPVNSLTLRIWYVEVLVDLLIVAAVVIAIPAFDRLERRKPFQLALGIALLLVSTRLIPFDVLPHPDLGDLQTVHQWTLFSVFAAFFFAFGWAIAKATTNWQRGLVSVLVIASLIGYFDPRYFAIARTYECAAFILLLIWLPRMKLPRWIVPATTLVANSSLFIFLTHWQVLELMPRVDAYTLAPGFDYVAIVLSIVTGTLMYLTWDKVSGFLEPRAKHAWEQFRAREHVPA
ncbi:AMP-binding protein [Smaragdicoccus niigatensis]|uniref:AMP-binding protein n=1 Tax=Smaragdicoccus niigatensis TaxID=359359 RepID=UPI000363B241|nr:AMP-binding protein [Smaragdicoccus niigatensis]